MNEKQIIVHVRLFGTREYEVFVYNSYANILDLEPSSRKVFSKVLLYKAPQVGVMFFLFHILYFFLYNFTFGKNTTRILLYNGFHQEIAR